MTNINLPSISLNITNSVSAGPGGVTREVLKPVIPPLVTSTLYIAQSDGDKSTYSSYSSDLFEIDPEPPEGAQVNSFKLKVNPNQQSLIAVNGADLSLYDLSGESPVFVTWPSDQYVGSVPAYHPSGSVFAVGTSATRAPSGDQQAVVFFDVDNDYAELPDISPLPDAIGQSVEFSPDGNYLAVGLSNGDRIRIYDATSFPYTEVAAFPSPITGGEAKAITWSPDSTRLFFAVSSTGYLFDTSSIPFVALTTPPSVTVLVTARYSPDGEWLLVSDGVIAGYDTSTDPYTKHTAEELFSDAAGGTGITSIAWNRDRSRVAINGSSLRMYNSSGDIPWQALDEPETEITFPQELDFD